MGCFPRIIMMTILKPLLVFFLASLCEIGGGYLMW